MNAVGLITEYNPFHNGHLHHLEESLKETGADVSVAVMSGHFLQRGEPALVDKWCRAEMALKAGVDVVIELPLPWACSSAPTFAEGGIRALNALHGVASLCFGSELGCIEPLLDYANRLCENADEIVKRTAALLKQGLTYPQARQKYLAEIFPEGNDLQDLDAPNNILGIEYLKALRTTNSAIAPATIERIGAGFHDSGIGQGGIASATGIRKRLREGQPVDSLMPAAVMTVLKRAINDGLSSSDERYFQLLLGQIFSQFDQLDRYWLVENGIENRLLQVADAAVDLEGLISAVKSRQLTRTRIQRMLISILLGLDKLDIAEQFASGPHYLHLLAVSARGEQFLAQHRKRRTIPLIQNFSRVYAILKRYYGADTGAYRQALTQLDFELRATRIYSLLLSQGLKTARNRDFFQDLMRQ